MNLMPTKQPRLRHFRKKIEQQACGFKARLDERDLHACAHEITSTLRLKLQIAQKMERYRIDTKEKTDLINKKMVEAFDTMLASFQTSLINSTEENQDIYKTLLTSFFEVEDTLLRWPDAHQKICVLLNNQLKHELEQPRHEDKPCEQTLNEMEIQSHIRLASAFPEELRRYLGLIDKSLHDTPESIADAYKNFMSPYPQLSLEAAFVQSKLDFAVTLWANAPYWAKNNKEEVGVFFTKKLSAMFASLRKLFPEQANDRIDALSKRYKIYWQKDQQTAFAKLAKGDVKSRKMTTSFQRCGL